MAFLKLCACGVCSRMSFAIAYPRPPLLNFGNFYAAPRTFCYNHRLAPPSAATNIAKKKAAWRCTPNTLELYSISHAATFLFIFTAPLLHIAFNNVINECHRHKKYILYVFSFRCCSSVLRLQILYYYILFAIFDLH